MTHTRSRKNLNPREITPKKEGFVGERHMILPERLLHAARIKPIVRDLFPSKLGHFPIAEGHFVQRPDPINEWIFIYCIEGRGWCSFNHHRWRLGADTMIVIPAGYPHAYGTLKRSPWSIYWLHVIGERCQDYLEAMQISIRNPVLPLRHGGQLIHHFEEMYDLLNYGHSPSVLFALSTSLAHFFGELTMQKRIVAPCASSTDSNTRDTISFMRRNLTQTLSLQELADYARLSVPHYSAIFQKMTGASPIQFFLRLKMQHAAELLADLDRKIKEVSEQVGFQDPYYFSRIFKQTMGISPKLYRAKHFAA